jgi:DNA (cytosine-5)-methyltransferase 1
VNRKLKVLDLFSGIGGFTLGLDSTGFFETVKFVEMDKYCQKVLQKNFPNIPIEEDIKNVKGKEYEADVITGGFPCQPFSVAGKQKGTNDNRYLWPEMLRLIREIKPEFVIGENVQGLINLQNGMVLRQVQDNLESEGFEVQCFLIPASGIGAWHQRYRVWIVGHSQHNGLLAAEKRCRDEKDYGGSQKGENETIESERTSGSRDYENVSNTDTRLSIGENEEVQARRETVDSSSSRRGEEKNVSNTESISSNERESRNSEEESGQKGQARNEIRGNDGYGTTKDVSNTDSGLRGGRRAIEQSGEDKVWRFYSEKKKQTRVNIRSKAVGRNAVSRKRNVSQSNNERCEESDISKKSKRQTLNNRGRDEKKDISNTSPEGLQRRNFEQELQEQELGLSSYNDDETKQTWWQIESNICGVPNGISYELDKNRANRIKTLGNAIVPQIAREFGLAIKKVLSDSDSDGQGG